MNDQTQTWQGNCFSQLNLFKKQLFYFHIDTMPERKYKRRREVSSFILQLLHMLQKEEAESSVCWLPDGLGFQIIDQVRFTVEVLPKYFKHRNLASFIRQLNIYEFSRIKDKKNIAYSHPHFQKNQEHLYKQIKRKKMETADSFQGSKTASLSKTEPSKLAFLYQCLQRKQRICLRIMKENEKLQKQISDIELQIQQKRKKNQKQTESFEALHNIDFHSTSRQKNEKKMLQKWHSSSSFSLTSVSKIRQFSSLFSLLENKEPEVNQINFQVLKNENISSKTSDS